MTEKIMAHARTGEVIGGEPSPMLALAEKAVAAGQMEHLEKLLDLHRQWEADQARKSYHRAISEFRANAPHIGKNKEVAYGHTRYRHATLDHVAEAVARVMSPLGLSFRWEVEQNDRITVTCWISHVDGHSEATRMTGPADTSGQKNAIQAIGSAVTYLQRYTLLAATGLAAGEDDDGMATAGEKISDQQADDLRSLAGEVGADWPQYLRFLGVQVIEDLPAKRYKDAVAALNAKRKKGARDAA